jgi:hypothetical protein
MDVPGAELLMNMNTMSSSSAAPDTKLPEMESISLDFTDLPNDPPPPPRLVPSADDVGTTKTWDGVENLNAEAYLKPVNVAPKMSEDAIMKKKYELLRKFERLNKLGVPIRKRFTMDSPLDEMEMELEFVRKEKAMDATIKQFSEWFITGMSAMEWGSKNVNMIKMFGLQLDGLSQSAQMNVGDLEEDFEELYDLYGDKMRMHPLVRIPMRTCFMVYMVHLTNQMAMKAPVPNIQEILKQNPDIARQMAAQAMQNQTQQFRQQAQSVNVPTFPSASANGYGNSAPQPQQQQQPQRQQDSNPLAGLMSFLGGVNSPPSFSNGQSNTPAQPTRTIPIKPVREMKSPSGMGIGDILNKIQKEEKKVGANLPSPSANGFGNAPSFQGPPAPIATSAPPPPPPPRPVPGKSALRKSAGSERKSAKNSVVIKL